MPAQQAPPLQDESPFRRLDLPTPTRLRTAAGAPGPGYWQQRADYRIIASLDERREVLAASGRLTYVNRSPDTLRELFVHQHLNAFRPGSRWAASLKNWGHDPAKK